MTKTTPELNKALVLEAFDTLFNKRDYDAAARFWSDRFIQHSAQIEPGREGLFNLVRSLPDSLRCEHGLILAEGDYVIVHGRFSGNGRPAAFIAAVRIENGRLAEHWDVLQDEATQAESKSGLPMFGSQFQAGVLRRIFDAIVAPRQTQVDRDIARILARTGGRLTDDIEREMTLRLFTGNLNINQ